MAEFHYFIEWVIQFINDNVDELNIDAEVVKANTISDEVSDLDLAYRFRNVDTDKLYDTVLSRTSLFDIEENEDEGYLFDLFNVLTHRLMIENELEDGDISEERFLDTLLYEEKKDFWKTKIKENK